MTKQTTSRLIPRPQLVQIIVLISFIALDLLLIINFLNYLSYVATPTQPQGPGQNGFGEGSSVEAPGRLLGKAHG